MPPPFGLLSNDPAALGNTGLAIGLLQGGGPSRTPSYFGPALAQGLSIGSELMLQGARSNAVTAFTEAETKNRLLQAESQQMSLDQARRSQAALEGYASSLPPGQREQFLSAPQAFLGALAKGMEPYSLGADQTRFVGNQPVAMGISKPQLVDVPVPGQPGVTQKMWLRPDQVQGPQVGGRAMPSILNPAVLAAEIAKANAGAARQMTLVNTFTPASEEAQKQFMQSTRQTYDQLKNAPAVLENIDRAKALIPSAKGFMGPGGEGMLEAAKFLNNRIGTSINTEGVKSAEELRSRVFFQIMENLKKMDAQPSQMQQQLMMDALGKLGTDPGALGRVLDSYGDVVRSKVSAHNQEVQGAVGQGVKFPYNPVINLPAAPKSPQGGGPAEDWIGRAMQANPGMNREQVIQEGRRLGKVPGDF